MGKVLTAAQELARCCHATSEELPGVGGDRAGVVKWCMRCGALFIHGRWDRPSDVKRLMHLIVTNEESERWSWKRS